MHTQRISQIAAIDRNRGLGKSGELLYHIPEDLRRFREKTKGHPVIMGRKTWESLPQGVRPMPGRANIVVTRQHGYVAAGAHVVPSIDGAIELAKTQEGSDEIFIIGGGDIYSAALPRTDRLYLTLVDGAREADAFFPEYGEFTKTIEDENHADSDPPYRYLTLERH